MTVRALLPDGTALEFPDGTADTVVDHTVRNYIDTRSTQTRLRTSDPAVITADQKRRGIAPTGRDLRAMYPEEAVAQQRLDRDFGKPAGEPDSQRYNAPLDPKVLSQAKVLAAMKVYAKATPDQYPGLFITEGGQQRKLTGREMADVLTSKYQEAPQNLTPQQLVDEAFGHPSEERRALLGGRNLLRTGFDGSANVYGQDDAVSHERHIGDLRDQRIDQRHVEELALKPHGVAQYVGNLFRQRAQAFDAGLARTISIVADTLGANELAEKAGDFAENRSFQAARRIDRPVSDEEYWNHPTFSNTMAYASERAAEAGVPLTVDMVAAFASLPVYAASIAGNSADARAANDGKTQADLEDLISVLPESMLNAALMRMPLSVGRGASMAGRFAESAATGAVVTPLSGAISAYGEGVGTQRSVEEGTLTPGFGLRDAVEMAVTGAAVGGALHSVGEAGRGLEEWRQRALERRSQRIANNAEAVSALDPNGYSPEDRTGPAAQSPLAPPQEHRRSTFLKPQEQSSPIADHAEEGFSLINNVAGDIFNRGSGRAALDEAVQQATAPLPEAEPAQAATPASRTPVAERAHQPIVVLQGRVTSKFGHRESFRTDNGAQASREHKGVDIAAAEGTPIPAAADGVVAYAGTRGGYGNYTIIQHPDGTRTAYGHQSEIDVRVGEHVRQGQEIGKVGQTGNATGPHLHFERIDANGNKIDPFANDHTVARAAEHPALAAEPDISEHDIARNWQDSGKFLIDTTDHDPVFDTNDEGDVTNDVVGMFHRETGDFHSIADHIRQNLDRMAQDTTSAASPAGVEATGPVPAPPPIETTEPGNGQPREGVISPPRTLAQRGEPGQGGWISSLYEGVRRLGIKNATLSEWLNHIYDEGGNRVKLPGVKLDELKETGMLTALQQIASEHKERISKEQFLDMVDNLLPHIEENTLDDKAMPGVGYTSPDSKTLFKGYTVEGHASQGYEEHVLRLPGGQRGNPPGTWEEDHWKGRDGVGRNPVVHFRFSTKETPDGKKVLFVEEIQSSLHSEASKRAKMVEKAIGTKVSGYREPVTDKQHEEANQAIRDATTARIKEAHATAAYLKSAAETLAADGKGAVAEQARGYADEIMAEPPPPSHLRAYISGLHKQEGESVGGLRLRMEMMRARNEFNQAAARSRGLQAVIDEAKNPMAPPRVPWAKAEAHTRLALRRVIQHAVEKGVDHVVWIKGDEQNGGRVGSDANGDWYYGNRELGGDYVDKNGDIRPAILPTTADKLVKPMGSRVRHDIPVKIESGLLPSVMYRPDGGPIPVDDFDRSQFEYMGTDDLRNHGNDMGGMLNGVRAVHGDEHPDVLKMEDQLVKIAHALAQKEGRVTYSGFDITPQMRAEAKRGMPMFKKDRLNPDAPEAAVFNARLKTFTREEKEQFTREIGAELAKRGADGDLQLRVSNWIEGAFVQGEHDPDLNSISIALAASANPFHTARHEFLHVLRTKDVITKQEWLRLSQEARKRVKGRINGRDKTYHEWAKRNYAGQGRAVIEEESIAEMVADFITKRNNFSGIEKILAKIGDIIAAVAAAYRKVTGKDPTAGDVLRGIESGEVGRRQRGEGGQGERGDEYWYGEMETLAQRRIFTPSILEDSEEAARTNSGQLVDMFKGLFHLIRRQPADKAAASLQQFAENWSDNMVGLKNVQARLEGYLGGPLPEEADAYLKQELSKSRMGQRIDQVREYYQAILKDMKKAEVDHELLGQYLALRHAPHRDAKIAATNPEFAGSPVGGSGYTPAELAQMEADIRSTGKWDEIDAIAKRVDTLVQYATKVKKDAGLLSTAQLANAFRPDEYYVPLKGHEEIDELGEDSFNVGRGRGITVTGKESKLMAGRKTSAPEADILAHVFAQAQDAIVRAEKNRVAVAVNELYKLHPDEAFWKHNPAIKRAYRDKATGEIKYRFDTNLTPSEAERAVGFKIDGEQNYIVFNEQSQTAMRVVTELRNMSAPEAGSWMRHLQRVMHTFKSLRTQYNPDFVINNLERDLQEGTFNLLGTELKDARRKVLIDAVPFTGKAWRAAMMGSIRGHGHGTGIYAKRYDDFLLSGGKTNFNRIDPLTAVKRDIKRTLDPSKWDRVVNAAKWIGHPIEVINDGVENALRFSAYFHAVENGLSEDQAASIAKNITVNFERHGNYGPTLNALYAFSNPSIQGNVRLLQTLKRAPARAARAAGIMVATGALLQLYNILASGEDEDHSLYWDNIPDWQKEKNWIVMTPGGKAPAIKFAKAWGISVFPNIGAAVVDMAMGRKGVAEAGASVGLAWLSAFNPVGGERPANVAAPTLVDPFVDLYYYNADFTGRPIQPTQAPRKEDEIPRSQLAWPSTPFYWKETMQFLNAATGGDDVQHGAVDVSPEVAKYWADFMVGGAGTTVQRFIDIPLKLFSGQEITTNDIPVARTFVINKTSEHQKLGLVFERMAQAEKVYTDIERYRKLGEDDQADRLISENQDLGEMYDKVEYTRKQLQVYSRARKALEAAAFSHKGLDKNGAVALGAVYGMNKQAALATIPQGKVPPEVARQVKEHIKQEESDLILLFNTSWNDTVKRR